MINCAIVGATGYTGAELIKILLRHSSAKIVALTTRQEDPIPVRQLIPTLPPEVDLEITQFSFPEIKKKAEVVFLCLPHTEAMEAGKKFREADKIVIDLSADFRLRDWKTYEAWYGVKHTQQVLLRQAVYGLPEIYRDQIQTANFISNPGCYPTAAALGIAPLLKKKLIDPEDIIVDAKSGVSGAGKKLTQPTQFAELDENFYAYKVGKHQHTPEIEQTLSDVFGKPVSITFTTHLLPVNRGILSTIYLKRKKGVKADQIRSAFNQMYQGETFVRILNEGDFPTLRGVQGTNYCDIGIYVDSKTDRVMIITAIDNLVKGASGQAVQNMNIRLSVPEYEGLKTW